jgi:hypothetical protein
VSEPAASTEALLDELNRWERDHGARGAAAGLASSGEAPSRIDALKQALAERGVAVQWEGDRYVAVPKGEAR